MRFPLLRFSLTLGCACAFLGAAPTTSGRTPVDLTQKSISSSKQFVIYCPDISLRGRVANFAEQVKREVLSLLGENDRWKYPVVMTLAAASEETKDLPPLTFGVYATEEGFKICIDVRIGKNPEPINLQRQFVRALMLEYAYRDKPGKIQAGTIYAEPPRWLIEGGIQIAARRDHGVNADFFKSLVATNKLPPIEQFLAERPADFGQTAQAIDQACSMCLVQLLLEQPDGKQRLASLLRNLPDSPDDPVAILRREFPMLGDSDNMQRWWTINLARFSAIDRYKGLTAEETDAQLSALIQFDLTVGKDGEKRTFTIDQFAEFLKLPESRNALVRGQASMVTLSTQANALYRPVVAEYEQILALLARGKTRGIKERLAKVSSYRETVLRRTADIADFMNWFEATQVTERSAAFDGYLKIANELETPLQRKDPVSKFLDEVERELAASSL